MQHFFLGADLGTSALKLTLIDQKGGVIRSISEHYPLLLPAPGYSEQSPSAWWDAFVAGISEIVQPEERPFLRGIAIAGQMHGLVALDKNGAPIRNAILWNDSRSIEECAYLNDTVGKPTLLKETGNIAYPGFTAPKILWMKKHEPTLFKKISHVLLPKDYLVYSLTGLFSTDYSDAAGTLLLDVREKKWSPKMLALVGLCQDVMPSIHRSGEVVGMLNAAMKKRLGLSQNVFVLAGAADNAAAAIGSGVNEEGAANISLGTSGTIYIPFQECCVDPIGAIHSFLSAEGKYCLLACSLSSASCLRWLYEDIYLTKDYDAEAARINPLSIGHNRVFFLPYLMGERSPINDPKARGLFIGMDLSTKREDLSLAVLEGVSFALRDSFERVKKLGGNITYCHITGGGAKMPLWRKILANVLNVDLSLVGEEAGASYGMCLLALVAGGIVPSLEDAMALVTPVETIHPTPRLVSLYEERYRIFKKIYPTTKELYPLFSE